jgi:cell division protease FtsH
VDIPADVLRRIAIHEAGHATAAIALKVSRNVSISLVQRGQRSATTYFDPEMEALTREVVERRIVVALAGRAAEEVLTGDVTAGSGGTETSDLAVANRLAFSTFAAWGLADVTWYGHWPPEQLLVIRPDLADEAHKMLQAAYARALELITQNREQVLAIAEALLLRRALPHEDIVALLQPAKKAAAQRPRRKRA